MRMRHPPVITNYLECHKKYLQKVGELKRKKGGKNVGRFCSMSCAGAFRSNNAAPLPKNCVCILCRARFHRGASNIKKSKSGLLFCSRKCKDAGQTIENGFKEMWPSGYRAGLSSYRQKAIKFYGPKCAECSFSIAPLLIVHHKDGDRTNNAMDNLIVLCHNHHAMKHLF